MKNLFSIFRKKKTNKDIIEQWLLTIENENNLPENIIALNFGLYEPYGTMDVIGSKSYDAQNDDWACNEDWIPVHRICPMLNIPENKAWNEVLAEMKRCIEELVQDHPTLKLWKITHITIGFADSDLTVIDNMPKSFFKR